MTQEKPKTLKTFRDLKTKLDSLTDAQLDCDLSLYLLAEDEFYPLGLIIEITDERTDVLDPGSPILIPTNLSLVSNG